MLWSSDTNIPEQYSADPRFHLKIPTRGRIEEKGDNIYRKDKQGHFVQHKSYHDASNVEKDTRVDSVLVSNHFFYFGRNGIIIPLFSKIIKKGPGHKIITDARTIVSFVSALEDNYQKGLLGEPSNFSERGVS